MIQIHLNNLNNLKGVENIHILSKEELILKDIVFFRKKKNKRTTKKAIKKNNQ